MCLTHPVAKGLNRWNWDGDEILFDAVVPSSRRPIGRTRGPAYDIDIREFLVTENNTVVRKELAEKLPGFLQAQGADPATFKLRGPYAFDQRAHLLAAYVAATIRYVPGDGRDPWQFPEETLALRSGDCEDIAFLLASLLMAAGISGYNVRVAIGKLHMRDKQGQKTSYDHVWVMYKCEAGHWLLLEPLQLDSHRPAPKAKRQVLQVDYEPFFLFNCNHLWAVKGRGNRPSFQANLHGEWKRWRPSFAGEVHQSILNEALQGAPQAVLDALNRHFSCILGIGPVVDDIDNFMSHGYDSRDHFDNGFIHEGWDRVHQRLAAFQAQRTDFDQFAYAAHGIADFYAHSSYLHFARLVGDRARPYDPADPGAGLLRRPSYVTPSGFDLATGPFSRNARFFKGGPAEAAQAWDGQLISGRYAQKGDSQGLIEALTFIPKELLNSPGFAQRGALPHHNEIAVDHEHLDDHHLLYQAGPATGRAADRLLYANQFSWRRATAVVHIRQAFVQSWGAI
jgi:Transglutaminase-like superfamily